MNPNAHIPVLLGPILNHLKKQFTRLQPINVLDATFGNGGYTLAIIHEFPNAKITAFDMDPHAITRLETLKTVYPARKITGILGSFSKMTELPSKTYNVVLMDLGVSSNQIEDPTRGFSHSPLRDGPLDMRMASSGGCEMVLGENSLTCETLVNNYSSEMMRAIILKYGEDREARKIADAICAARQRDYISTTSQLAKIVKDAKFKKKGLVSPCARTFQAFRIYLNNELGELRDGLFGAENILREDGVLYVVSFHSLEDRLVKKFIRNCSKGMATEPDEEGEKQKRWLRPQIDRDYYEADLEMNHLDEETDEVKQHEQLEDIDETLPSFLAEGKVIKPTTEEVEHNSRSRSAKLRIAIRTSNNAVNNSQDSQHVD